MCATIINTQVSNRSQTVQLRRKIGQMAEHDGGGGGGGDTEVGGGELCTVCQL